MYSKLKFSSKSRHNFFFIIGLKNKMETHLVGERYVPVVKIDISDFRILNTFDSSPELTKLSIGFGNKKKVNKPQSKENAKHVFHYQLLKQLAPDSLSSESFIEALKKLNHVDVVAISKGKGTQGVMYRWNFHGGPASHGSSKFHRKAGSVGQDTPRKLFKGTKMAGKEGNKKVSIKNLRIVKIDEKSIYLRGSIPGNTFSPVLIKFKG